MGIVVFVVGSFKLATTLDSATTVLFVLRVVLRNAYIPTLASSPSRIDLIPYL